MRRYMISALALAAVVTACSGVESPTGPNVIPRLQGRGNDPDRIRIREHRTEPFVAPAMGCVEPMVVTGNIHVMIFAQDNPADRVHYRSHSNLQGVSAVGQVTGTRYRLAQVFNATLNYNAFLEPPQFTTNQVFRYRVIGQRTLNNFWFDIHYHLTVTPDGQITASFIRVEGRCGDDGPGEGT